MACGPKEHGGAEISVGFDRESGSDPSSGTSPTHGARLAATAGGERVRYGRRGSWAARGVGPAEKRVGPRGKRKEGKDWAGFELREKEEKKKKRDWAELKEEKREGKAFHFLKT